MLVADRNSVAYFYAVAEDGFELTKVAEKDRKMLQSLQGHFESSKK